MSALDLAGKKIVVTGAAGGLGRAFAMGFAREGAIVIAGDLNLVGAEETAAQIRNAGGTAHAVHLDVTDTESCNALRQASVDLMGGADVLINNAAALAGIARKPFWDLEDADWDLVLNVNVKGTWRMTRALLPLLKTSSSGAVINLASVTAYSGSAHWMHYVASKGAVISLTRVMAKELGPMGIRANALAPGLVPTEALSGLFEGAATYGIDKLALGRQASTEDIVGGALYLASGLSAFVTGQTIIIDGGRQFI
jgi:NAD(P)-dependent dehydrogenase (short-subunit alcohol dehydrogenase family)